MADGERAVFADSAPIHVECLTETDHLVDVAAAFLRHRPGTPVCRACLARTLGITEAEARKMTNALRLTADYCVVVGGRCGICRRATVTIEPVDRAARKPLAQVR
jgi:hypothetical protein